MGRVYNALVKADRWKERDRPIGRPERDYAEKARRRDSAPVRPLNPSSAATAPFLLDDDFASPVDLRASGFGQSSVAAEPAEVPAAVPYAVVPRSVTPQARRPIAGTLPPSATGITFEEPTDVSNIYDRAIDPHVAALTGDDPLAVERYRRLAAKLVNLADRRKLKTLLITSAEEGEGKTTVATGAAWLLARHPGRRVLLIDARPSSSSVGRMLGIDAKRGWLNLVDGSCELKHALMRLEPNGLYVLTAGAPAAAQSIDASSSRLEDLITDLAARFDLVIVDSGSILESSEAQRLATVLDGVVIVARAGHTRHSKVNAARKLVPKERRLGVVLNEAEAGAELADRRSKGKSVIGRLFGRKR
jgi:capsular exopolysaccharide synthesis family protein